MEKKYDATYQFGKTTVHVIAPQPMTAEQIAQRIEEHDRILWHWWQSLSPEEQLQINAKLEEKKKISHT